MKKRNSLLIKNGELITATDQFYSDIYIENGTIQAIGNRLDIANVERTIDGSGHYIFPGAVDAHVHMELPVMGTFSADDFETGTAAGIAGGTTSIIDFVTPNRQQSLLEALAERKAVASKSVSDYALHMTVTSFNSKTAEEMAVCVRTEGITSFKTYLAYKESIGIDDEVMIKIMSTAQQLGALITTHCENGDLVTATQKRLLEEGKREPKFHPLSRPAYVEAEATHRAITLARATGVNLYIVHVTSQDALGEIIKARNVGQSVYAETCPHYLLLDDSVYGKKDFQAAAYVLSPPIRPLGHSTALWAALKSGQLQTVATDHCPFNLKGQKEMGRDDFSKIPNGAAGVQNRLVLLYTYGVLEDRISLNQLVDISSTGPAKIFGLYPRKGSISVGADADLVVWNPEPENIISARSSFHNVDTNIFEGYRIKGEPTWVIANGKVQFEEGKLDVEQGAGRYIHRSLTGGVRNGFPICNHPQSVP
jgi:dihydropyrimidinase